jgi:hypothetical protein
MKSVLLRLFAFALFVSALTILPVKALAAARLYVSPASGSYKVGDKVTASVMVDTGGDPINAGEGTVTYSTDILEYQSVSTSGSIFTFWTNGPSAGSGNVAFGGGLSHPGYTGSGGKLLTVTFKAKAAGAGLVSINDGRVLADDGSGTNIYGGSHGATFAIGGAAVKATPAPTVATVTVKSTTHPDSTHWYNAKTVALSWSASGVSQFSFTFDQSPATDPAEAVSATTTKSYEATSDGAWYFHVKGKTATGFTPVTHFKVQIDTTPPGEFAVTIDQDGGATNPTPKVTFSATDLLGGIDKYTARIDSGEEFAIKSGDALPKQKPGHHTIIIKAYDKAGNSRTAQADFTIDGISPPTIISWDHVVSLLHPITFIGRSSADDTIVAYLEGKEVARFTAKQNQTYDSGSTIEKASSANNEITWKYTYSPLLAPGSHTFTFSRITPAGLESAPTEPLAVSVEASSVQIMGYIIPLRIIIITLLVLILLLLLWVIYLAWQNHRIAHGEVACDTHNEASKEKEILRAIDTTLSAPELSPREVKSAKKELKDKVHKTLHDE